MRSATSKTPSAIANVGNDGRPIETPLNATPGTTVYGPAVSRGAQWERVRIQAWHTDSVARVCTVAWIDADGSTVVCSTTISVDPDSGPIEVVAWRMRLGAYLSVWWDAASVGWVKVEADVEAQGA